MTRGYSRVEELKEGPPEKKRQGRQWIWPVAGKMKCVRLLSGRIQKFLEGLGSGGCGTRRDAVFGGRRSLEWPEG